METLQKREAWYKGKLVGQKPPLKPKDIWAIRIRMCPVFRVSLSLHTYLSSVHFGRPADDASTRSAAVRP